MEGTAQPGLTSTTWSALGDEVPVMLDDHDGRAVREQAVEDSEQGLHVEPKQTARIAENSQLAGHFRRWWQVMDSNHRRRSRRFADLCRAKTRS
jgi:hypothetical protein